MSAQRVRVERGCLFELIELFALAALLAIALVSWRADVPFWEVAGGVTRTVVEQFRAGYDDAEVAE